MKWETLKLRVTRELCHRVSLAMNGEVHVAATKLMRDLFDGVDLPESIRAYLDRGNRIGESILEAAKDEVIRRVDAWDIRGVGVLRNIVPEAFPKNLRHGQLTAEPGGRGGWEVYPAPRDLTQTTPS
jgi:hypothetical protein